MKELRVLTLTEIDLALHFGPRYHPLMDGYSEDDEVIRNRYEVVAQTQLALDAEVVAERDAEIARLKETVKAHAATVDRLGELKQSQEAERKAIGKYLTKKAKRTEQSSGTWSGDSSFTGGRINLSETYLLIAKRYVDALESGNKPEGM